MAGNQHGRAEPDREHTATTADSDLDELLTVEDVATLLRVPKSWVYERTRSRGKPRADCLPSIKLGKYVRFDARAVRGFLLRRSKLA
jgi:excisionase family DNA binding protein